MPFLFPLVKLLVVTGVQRAASQVMVRALWELARRTPGLADDAAIKGLAVSLGVDLEDAPTGQKTG